MVFYRNRWLFGGLDFRKAYREAPPPSLSLGRAPFCCSFGLEWSYYRKSSKIHVAEVRDGWSFIVMLL